MVFPIAATDLEIGIKTTCVAKVKKEGSITTPAKNFLEIIRSFAGRRCQDKEIGKRPAADQLRFRLV